MSVAETWVVASKGRDTAARRGKQLLYSENSRLLVYPKQRICAVLYKAILGCVSQLKRADVISQLVTSQHAPFSLCELPNGIHD